MIKKLFVLLLLLFGIGSMGSVCATEQTNYPYWIEDVGNGNYNIWTKVTISANGEKVIYIKKVDGYSPNGDELFEFFDDFDGTSLDTNKWDIRWGSFTVSNSNVNQLSAYSIDTTSTFNNPVIVEVRWKDNDGSVGRSPSVIISNGNIAVFSAYGEWGNNYYTTANIFTSDNYMGGWNYVPVSSSESFSLDTSKYHKTIIKYNKNNFISSIDGHIVNYNHGFDEFHIGLGSPPGTDCNHLYDYIFVRKYIQQEPVVSVEQVDNSNWKVTIHNPNNVDLNNFQIKIDGTGVNSKTDSILINDNAGEQYLTLSVPNIWNVNTPVTATVSGHSIENGATVYLDWKDGTIDSQIYNGEDLQFQHTYSETGTYNIKAYVNSSISSEKQIIITENLTSGALHFKPLYENTTITGWAIVNGMNISISNTTTIFGILGSPVKIQTDKGYMTSIPFSVDMTAYIAGSEYQYVTVSLSADNPITVKNGEKVVGYGKNVYITQPVGDTITVWCNNKKIREYILRSSIDDYIYIPKQHIIANLKENNEELSIYLETWRKEKLHIQVENNNTAIFQTEGYYQGFQRIDTGITPEAGKTYTLTILDEDGNVVSYSTYTYTPETEKPDIPEQEGYIWIAFLIGVIIMVMGVIADNLPIALIGIGLFVLLVPYNIPYLDHLAAISTALAIIIIITKHIKRNTGE